MTCYKPLQAYSFKKNSNGKKDIRFGSPNFDSSLRNHPDYEEILIPCSRCVGCRLKYSREWAIRCTHEASLYEDNCFITLTYNDKSLPYPPTLNVREFQLFMKKLRKRFPERRIRFFHCGEYGEKYGRPHYHAILFNFDFPDKTYWKKVNDNKLYTSEILQELWPYGYSSIGSVTFESTAYVARYIMKKVTGDLAEKHYEKIDNRTGQIFHAKPEYTTMSRKPGIAKKWFDTCFSDVYPHDFVVLDKHDGSKYTPKPPKYYDKLYEIEFPEDYDKLKKSRLESASTMKALANSTPDRLRVREEVSLARLGQLIRPLESGENHE
jgi:hypothetical protein